MVQLTGLMGHYLMVKKFKGRISWGPHPLKVTKLMGHFAIIFPLKF